MKQLTPQPQQKKHIAVLGFAEPCSSYNMGMAYVTGVALAKQGYVVTAGNMSSTFHCAFKGAKRVAGNTLAVLEEQREVSDANYCDVVLTVEDTAQKHRLLADLCSSAIIIGGGPGTKHLEERFILRNKPVIALEGTGGITRTELHERTQCVKTIQDTLTLIH